MTYKIKNKKSESALIREKNIKLMLKMDRQRRMDKLWYEQQNKPIPIKDLGKNFRKEAKKEGFSKKEIDKYLENW